MTALSFRGNGTEYFKIWIVNILLTIVTLGLYHPWAKVRTRRYFYGNTSLDNANFDYHATGKQLFLSYVIAMVLFGVYVVLGQVSPVASLVVAGVLFLSFPWIIWRGIKFNLRMSSYRNVRFGFNGKLSDSYATFLAFPIGMLLIFGLLIFALIMGLKSSVNENNVFFAFLMPIVMILAYPAFIAMMNKLTNNFIINGIHFGQAQLSATFSFKTFFVIIIKAMFIGIILTILMLVVISLLAYLIVGIDQLSTLPQQLQNMEQGAEPNPLFFILIFGMYALLIPVSLYVIAYLKARHRSYIMDQAMLDDSISFESTLKANTYFWIVLTNLLLIIFTAGLAYPWTAVRTHRYLIESTHINAPNSFDNYFSKGGKEGAIGEELSDAFDIDVGGIAF